MRTKIRKKYNMAPSQNDPTIVIQQLASHRQKRSIRRPMGKARISERRNILNRGRKVPPKESACKALLQMQKFPPKQTPSTMVRKMINPIVPPIVFGKAKVYFCGFLVCPPCSYECAYALIRAYASPDLAGGFCRVGGPDRHTKGRRVVPEET